MNNNSEQPPEDLFAWAEHSSSNTSSEDVTYASPDDGLGWTCSQCELEGHLCERCSTRKAIEDVETANKILQIEGHKPKPSGEIPLEEFIAGLNEIKAKVHDFPESNEHKAS